MIILGDNQSAIALSRTRKAIEAKHVDIKYHFVRNALYNKKTEIVNYPTTHMITDENAKPLTKLKLERLKRLLLPS